jgi:HK97 gp10 family phage protein
MTEFSLTGLATFLTEAMVEMDHAKHEALEKAAKIVEDGSKKAIGTYEFGWPPLAESTLEKKAADTPLLETGELRDSIRHEVDGDTARIGSDLDYALYQEVGTSRIPPRSFLMQSAVHHRDEIVHEIGHTMVTKLVDG